MAPKRTIISARADNELQSELLSLLWHTVLTRGLLWPIFFSLTSKIRVVTEERAT